MDENKKKEYEPPKMKVLVIHNQPKLLCGSNAYWNDCEKPSEDEWWGKI